MTDAEDLFQDGFLTYLPMDNDEGSNVESHAALETLDEELTALLKLSDLDFWKVVKAQPTLHDTLDSYLRFRKRAFHVSDNQTVSYSALHASLHRHVFFLMLRLVTVPEKMTASFRQRQAQWLYDQWIVDVPKILDLCVLYGKENKELMQELLRRMFQLQPACLKDLEEAIPILVDNLYHLQERCSNSIQMIAQGDEMGLFGWNDVLKYLLDICVNLSSFLELCPPAGHRLLRNRGSLLCTLTTIHDSLLPQFEGALREMSNDSQDLEELVKEVHLALAAIEKTAAQMFTVAFLSPDAEITEQSQFREEALSERGQQMMNVIMSIAHTDDRDVSFSLLFKANARFQLGDQIIQAIEQGNLSLDDAQFDYLSMLVHSKHRPASLRSVKQTNTITHLDSAPSTSKHPSDPQRAELLSKISKVKDVLPDLGDGFVEQCLKEYGMDTEKVVMHILDGSLPSSLSRLDHYMLMSDGEPSAAPSEEHPSSAAEKMSSRETFFKQFLFPDSIGPGWNAQYNETPPSSDIKNWAKVRVGKSKKVDRRTARFLDQSGSEIRQIVIRQANELLANEYEDEYDDSYDDLGVGGADGQADVEGDGEQLKTKQNSKKPYFVKDGKIYNAPTEGAVAVKGLNNAQTAAANKDEEIHGLKRGGNLPADGSSSASTSGPNSSSRGQGQTGRRGRGRRGGRSKNHNQKDRSLKKQQL